MKIQTKAHITLAVIVITGLLALWIAEPNDLEKAQAIYENAQDQVKTYEQQVKEAQALLDEALSFKVKAEALVMALGGRMVDEGFLSDLKGIDAKKLQVVLDEYKSPINAKEYATACADYPSEMCKIFVGVMAHESKFCTHFYKPEVEKDYHNCSGWKSPEILATHKADKNGSWLQKFDSYPDYFNFVLGRFYALYWNQGLRTPETIVKKYVGKYSQNWVDKANKIKSQL